MRSLSYNLIASLLAYELFLSRQSFLFSTSAMVLAMILVAVTDPIISAFRACSQVPLSAYNTIPHLAHIPVFRSVDAPCKFASVGFV